MSGNEGKTGSFIACLEATPSESLTSASMTEIFGKYFYVHNSSRPVICLRAIGPFCPIQFVLFKCYLMLFLHEMSNNRFDDIYK